MRRFRFIMPALVTIGFFTSGVAVATAMTAMSQKQADKLNHAIAAGDHQAIEKLRRMAQQGDAVAHFSLGKLYDYGQGVKQDNAERPNGFVRSPKMVMSRPNTISAITTSKAKV